MVDAGITVVSSSGDGGDKDLLFPANVPKVVSVAASQGDGSIWRDSNVSNKLTCAFPGYRIAALDSVNNALSEGEDSGTSQACAVASSYIALYRDASGYTDHGHIVSMLKSLDTLSEKKVDYLSPFTELS